MCMRVCVCMCGQECVCMCACRRACVCACGRVCVSMCMCVRACMYVCDLCKGLLLSVIFLSSCIILTCFAVYNCVAFV